MMSQRHKNTLVDGSYSIGALSCIEKDASRPGTVGQAAPRPQVLDCWRRSAPQLDGVELRSWLVGLGMGLEACRHIARRGGDSQKAGAGTRRNLRPA